MPSRRSVALAAMFLLIGLIHAPAALAASQIVECGQYSEYTAPDPAGPTVGSLRLRSLPAWTIDPNATITPPADTNLPTLLTGVPTCLRLDLDDLGVITALEFVPEGTIEGPVTFDGGGSLYVLDERITTPTFVTDAYPALFAVFDGSLQAGTDVSVTLLVDPVTGVMAGLEGTARYCGIGSIDGDGDGRIGDSMIPAAALDAQDVKRLGNAGSRRVCATIQFQGTLDTGTGALDLTSEVTIDVAAVPTAPPTSIAGSSRLRPDAGDALGWVVLSFAFSGSLILASARRSRAR